MPVQFPAIPVRLLAAGLSAPVLVALGPAMAHGYERCDWRYETTPVGGEENPDKAGSGCWRSALGWQRFGLQRVVRSGSWFLPSQDDGELPRRLQSVATDCRFSRTLSRDCDWAQDPRAQVPKPQAPCRLTDERERRSDLLIGQHKVFRETPFDRTLDLCLGRGHVRVALTQTQTMCLPWAVGR